MSFAFDTAINNLKVVNSTGDNVTFQQRDCYLEWDAVASEIKNFIVRIYDQGTANVLYVASTGNSTNFAFTFEKNVALVGGPHRRFDVSVTAVDPFGNEGSATSITPYNAQAGMSSNLRANTSFGAVEIAWDAVIELELAGYYIKISPDQTFATGSLVYQVGPNNTSFTPVLGDDTYYYAVAAYDVFGTDNIQWAVAASPFGVNSTIDTTDLVDFPLELSETYKVPLLTTGGVWAVNGTTLTWQEHSLWYDGIKYTVAAGSTTDEFVYWVKPVSGTTTAYLTALDEAALEALALDNELDEWQVARNFGTSFDLAWNAQANMVIGTANIGKAAVQNINIGNIIQSDGFYIGAGGTTRGWRLDKAGKIVGRDIEIYDANGNLVFHVDTGLDYSNVNNGPPEDATANNLIYWSYYDNGNTQPVGYYGDIWVNLDDDQIHTHNGVAWVAGRTGVDSISAMLTNESHTIPTYSDGTGYEFTGSNGVFKVMKGAADVVAECVFSVSGASTKNGLTIAIDANGAYSLSGAAWVSDAETFTLVATYDGYDFAKVYSVAKAKAGFNGSATTVYEVEASSLVVTRSSAGVANPLSVTFSGFYTEGSAARLPYTGRFKIYLDGGIVTSYVSASNESEVVYTVPAEATSIKCEMYSPGGSGNLMDNQNVVIVSDGVDGDSVYIAYHDDPADGDAPDAPTDSTGSTGGWYTIATATSNWMSVKIDDGTSSNWGAPVKIRGVDGASSLQVVITSNSGGYAFKNNSGSEKILSVTVYDAETGATVNPLAYQWKKNGVNLATTATITVNATDVADGGSEQYSCEVTV
jgi:hypothetical protein